MSRRTSADVWVSLLVHIMHRKNFTASELVGPTGLTRTTIDRSIGALHKLGVVQPVTRVRVAERSCATLWRWAVDGPQHLPVQGVPHSPPLPLPRIGDRPKPRPQPKARPKPKPKTKAHTKSKRRAAQPQEPTANNPWGALYAFNRPMQGAQT